MNNQPSNLFKVAMFVFFIVFVIFITREGPHRGYGHIIENSYAGKITKKYIDYNYHGSELYSLDNGSSYGFNNEIAYNLAAVGDSIIKKKGTLATKLKKRDTEIVFYPTVRGVPVKD